MEMIELAQLASNRVQFAKDYLKARQEAGNAKSSLDIMLAGALPSIRAKKSNAGYEISIIMLCENNMAARELYETMVKQTATYKGLEKLLDALGSQISLEQSKMKYVKDSERYSG